MTHDYHDRTNWRTAPIRTDAQIAEILRQRGDATINARNVEWIRRQALKKLREALSEFADGLEC